MKSIVSFILARRDKSTLSEKTLFLRRKLFSKGGEIVLKACPPKY